MTMEKKLAKAQGEIGTELKYYFLAEENEHSLMIILMAIKVIGGIEHFLQYKMIMKRERTIMTTALYYAHSILHFAIGNRK